MTIFDFLADYKLAIEPIGRGTFKAILLDASRNPTPIGVLPVNFHLGKWSSSRSPFFKGLVERLGVDKSEVRGALDKIGSEITLKGVGILGTLKRKEPKPESTAKEVIPPEYANMTLEGYKKIVKKWLYIDKADDEVIDVIVATALDREFPGEPIWLFVVGPPGSTKTELLRSFVGKGFYTTSTITAHTLITGLKDEMALDLLPELDGKVLILKDFTTTLTDETNLQQILSQLREAYDGYLEMNFGSGVGKKSYHSTFGLIAGVTPAIDAYYSVQALLGERFLKIRMVTNQDEATKRAFEKMGQEEEMRKEIRFATLALLDSIKAKKETKVEIPKEISDKLLDLAVFTATARTGIHRDRQRFVTVLPEPEVGTRLAKQLKKLILILTLLRDKTKATEAEYTTILRVALDSMPKKRLRALAALNRLEIDPDDPTKHLDIPHSSRAVGQAMKAPTNTTTEVLEDLWSLRMIKRFGDEKAFTWHTRKDTLAKMVKTGISSYLQPCNQGGTLTDNLHSEDEDDDTKPTPPRLHGGKSEGQQTLNVCEKCGEEIIGAIHYVEDGTRFCDKCVAKYKGRV